MLIGKLLRKLTAGRRMLHKVSCSTSLHLMLMPLFSAPDSRPMRVAVVGIGQELRGDDGAGPAVIKLLVERADLCGETTLLVDAGVAPENVLGSILRHMPDVVLFIDAADFSGSPGSICMPEADDCAGFGGSCHSLPLSVLSDFLRTQCDARIGIIGIQLQQTTFGTSLSPSVAASCAELAQVLADLLAQDQRRSEVTASFANTAGGVSLASTW